MKRKNTDQLLQELMDSNDLSRVLSDNSACFREGDLPHGLQVLFDQQDMSKTALAKASGISEVYLHQVFSGRRTPSRDRLLCLCIYAKLFIEGDTRTKRKRLVEMTQH